MSSKIDEAFAYCEKIARSHYENFPIGWVISKPIRKHLFAIYAFARTADDFSDEEAFAEGRLEHLDLFEAKLDRAIQGSALPDEDLLFIALSETLDKTGIPSKLLKNLLTAFRLDITKKRYRNFQELEDYCVYSANPIGRIVLLLFGYQDPKLLALSDRICTGIQLVNHWQDIGIDLSRDRVYLPEEDLRRFDYSYSDLSEQKVNDSFRALMRFEISRARSLFYEGRPLLEALERRLRWQISLMWLGPMRILDKIEKSDFDLFRARPTLSKRELARLFLKVPFQKR